MSDYIQLYPVYDPKSTTEIFEIQPYSFEYTDENGKIFPLELCPEGVQKSLFFLEDEDGIWGHEEYGFGIKRRIMSKGPSLLFGSGKYAVAFSDATLGLALVCSSKSSSRKTIKKIGSFTKSDSKKEFVINETFKRCEFRGEVGFTIILYLESPGTETGEELFINQQGFVIGELDSITILIDGNGSILPVYYEDVPRGPLWRVNCNWGDPFTDEFSNPDNVAITINRKNPNFKYIDKRDEAYNPHMANEVMASAITMIIETLRNDKVDFNSLDNAVNGSICDAVRYFRDVLAWDLKSPISVNKSIREAFENKKK